MVLYSLYNYITLVVHLKYYVIILKNSRETFFIKIAIVYFITKDSCLLKEINMGNENLTLLTDFYELTMAQGYFKNNANHTVVFDAFYRKNPSDSGYAICAGLEQVIEYIKNLHFTEGDIKYLRSLKIFDEDFLEYLSTFRFTGNIYAIPEGSVIFPMTPLIKVVAPMIEAQLIETAILNIINHQSLIATKAARVCHAAGEDGVMEFGLRRAQGPDAGTLGARAAVIGGCIGTSNVLAAKKFDVPALGTHGHSWIMSFDDELTAFRKYAKLYPNGTTLLVDTYDTLRSGVPNAIKVFQEMKEAKILTDNYGIRLDSGDLAYLSKKARKMLDEAGFKDAIITASSDLDEYLIQSLKSQGSKIDSWGVGTNLITSKDSPSFGGVYKLAAIEKNGKFIPKMKLSDNTWKVTNPGDKVLYRVYEKETGKMKADLLALSHEVYSEEEPLLLFDPIATWKKTYLKAGSYKLRQMLEPIFIEGECVYTSPSVMEIREYCKKEKDTLWEETKRFLNPHLMYVDLSKELYDLKRQLLDTIHGKEN